MASGGIDEAAKRFIGKWLLISSDNFDEYMKALGVGWAKRKMGNLAKPSLTITLDEATGVWTSAFDSTFKSGKYVYTLGTPVQIDTPDDRTVMATFTFEDGKMWERQTPIKEEDKANEMSRQLDDDGNVMTCICTVDSIECKRIYHRAPADHHH